MFRQIVSQLAKQVIVPVLSKSKPFVEAARKTHETVEKLKNSEYGKKFEDLKKSDGKYRRQWDEWESSEAKTKKPVEKKTEKITKSGPEDFTLETLQSMSVKQIKDQISQRGLTLPAGAFEKSDFVEVLVPFAREATPEEEMEKVLHGAHDSIFAPFKKLRDSIKEDYEADMKSFNEKMKEK